MTLCLQDELAYSGGDSILTQKNVIESSQLNITLNVLNAPCQDRYFKGLQLKAGHKKILIEWACSVRESM